MKTVDNLLKKKGSQIWAIAPDASIYEAVSMMAEKGIGALLVMEGEQLHGIISERDYARKVILAGKSSRQTPVREIMTTAVLCAKLEQSVEQCLALMTDKRIRHLPVADGGKVVGLVSIGDLVKEIIAEQQFIIEQLEHYIAGQV
ncbi:MAG: CBS domain-containing protein [Chromatiales bacterium]|jgi:CBS domain-containing protein|nr:CBS domain-containing protein [Chromatiales bacterium]MDH4013422.1 CBS domain-containing protein [Chromatiales bacterium]